MANRYIKDNLEKRIWMLGIENTGDFVNEAVKEKVEKEEKKK